MKVCWLWADNVTTASKILKLTNSEHVFASVRIYSSLGNSVTHPLMVDTEYQCFAKNETVRVRCCSISYNLAQVINNEKINVLWQHVKLSTWQLGLPKLKPIYYYYYCWENYLTCTFCEHCLLFLCFITAFFVFLQKPYHLRRKLDLSASQVSAYAVYPADCGKY
mgnify:CR=1 FL=1